MRLSTDRLIAAAPDLRTPDELLDTLQCVSLKHPQRLKVIGIGVSGSAGSEGELNRDIFFHPDFPAADYLSAYRTLEEKHGTNPLSNFRGTVSRSFTLTDAMRALRLTGEARWSFDLFREFGVRDGLCVVCGQWLVVYSAEQPLQLERGARFQLAMAASVAIEWMEQFVKARRRRLTASEGRELSDREKLVLCMVAEGKTRDQTATELHLGLETVRTYIRRILEKLNAKNVAHAVHIAWQTGIFDDIKRAG